LFARVAAVYVVARGLTWLGLFVALRRWSRARQAHWSERARLAMPARRIGRLCFVCIVVPLVLVLEVSTRRIEVLPVVITDFLMCAAGYIGVMQSRLAWEFAVNPALVRTPQTLSAIWIFRASLIGILGVFGFVLFGLVSYTEGAAAWAVAALGVLGTGIYLSWGWVWLLRRLKLLRPAMPRLLQIVSAAARRVDARSPVADELALPVVNALAFVGTRSIAVTDPALAVLSDDELATVCAHELAHLGEPRWMKATRLANGFIAGALVAAPSACLILFRDPIGAVIVWAFVGAEVLLFAYLLIFVRLFRRMEVRADAVARAAEPAPGTYARALEKIYEANLVPVVVSSRRHRYPELYDRLVQAGAPPDYPRPEAPPQRPTLWAFVTVLAGTGAACALLGWLAATVAAW
jgi:Zn-dependent protease with chaperone function